MTRIEVLSSYKPVPGFQRGTVGHTKVTKIEKIDMDLVTILPTHFVPYVHSYVCFLVLKNVYGRSYVDLFVRGGNYLKHEVGELGVIGVRHYHQSTGWIQ